MLTKTRTHKTSRPPVGFFEKIFLKEKLNHWLGYFFIAAIAAAFGYLIATQTFVGLGLFGLILGFFTVVACMVNTETGLYINIFYAFFAFHLSRYLFNDAFQVGIVVDILIGATFLSLLLKRGNLRSTFNSFVKTPVVVAMLVFLFYLLLQLFNPSGGSFDGWLQTFRRFLGSVFLLFIAYNLFTDYRRIRRFFTVLFVLCVVTGLYGCIQEWHGLFDFELAWVHADDNRFGLYFIMGDFRKFSTMSDPTAYGVVMASCSIIYIIIAWHQKSWPVKIVLLTGVLIMLLGMSYSGTRTANVMVVAGIGLFIMLTINKKATRFFAIASALVFVVVMYGPYANSTIIRIRSSFAGSDDESFKVRNANRATIQPYIWKHPIGGGLGTTGGNGLRHNPGHYLAGFPPDSGYLKKALETGWIGLIMICVLYFLVIKTGIRTYFSTHTQRLKILYAAITASIFSFYIGEYAQETIGQITDIVVYYPLIAILLKLPYIDRKTEETADLILLK